MNARFSLSDHDGDGFKIFCVQSQGDARITASIRDQIAQQLPDSGPKPKFDVTISASPQCLDVTVTRHLFQWGEWKAFTGYCEALRVNLENWVLENA